MTADGTHGQIIVFCPEIPGGETTTPDPSQPTTKPPVVNPWKVVNGSDNKFYYNNITKQGISDVVNVQKPDFAEQTGIYISLPEAISEVTVNGKTSGVAAIQGAGAVVYLSALDRYFNKVSFKRGENTSYIEIRNVEGTLLYDVEDFKSGEHYTYPEYDGKVFAGWYTDSSYETVYTPNSGQAYAKFIDEEVLSVKFQWANDRTALRFLTSVDDEAYLDAGFIISGTYGNSSFTNKERHAKVLYYSVLANGVKLYPNTEFHESSKFFATYTLSGMNPSTKSTWAVRAFYVTPDGTTVISDEYEHEYTP